MAWNTLTANNRPAGTAAARRNPLHPFVALLLLAVVAGCGTTPEPRDRADHRAGNEIRELTDRMWAALGDQDLNAFREVSSDDWHLYTAGGSRFTAERLFEVHEANIRGFELEADAFELRIAGDIAWATYTATMSGERQGEPWGGEFLVTHIYERVDGDWYSVHTHESRVPESD